MGQWQHYQTKTNEADVSDEADGKTKGIRHRIVDENNSLRLIKSMSI